MLEALRKRGLAPRSWGLDLVLAPSAGCLSPFSKSLSFCQGNAGNTLVESCEDMIAKRKNQAYGCGVYEPTPKAIRRACKRIQATWSPRERGTRYRGPCAAWWIPPNIRLSGLSEAVNVEQVDAGFGSAENAVGC
jgi:hypothetical protein